MRIIKLPQIIKKKHTHNNKPSSPKKHSPKDTKPQSYHSVPLSNTIHPMTIKYKSSL